MTSAIVSSASLSGVVIVVHCATTIAGSCRTWTATAPNYGMDLRFESMNAREQACDAQEKAMEAKYLDALAATRMVQMRAGYLVLMDEHGRERLYFARGG